MSDKTYEEILAEHDAAMARLNEEKAQWEVERQAKIVERERRNHENEVRFARLEELERNYDEKHNRSIGTRARSFYRRVFGR